LTVGGAEPGGHLGVDERLLRNRLRAHGRQLGDQRDPKTGTQSINRLLHECAYEHWHRMLFARFLAENHLLIHDKEGIPVTLAECDELARDEVVQASGLPATGTVAPPLEKVVQASGLPATATGTVAPLSAPPLDGWTLAARYAARMLPQIFRPDDPVLQVGLAPEHKRALEKLVTELPVEIFTADDSLGWVYQFWQAERKDEVNASGAKITGETLPAVTQLFTEHYMVLFLLHNTLGAWWAARLKAEGRIENEEWQQCQTEDDCRKLVALPGHEFTYLRFIRTDVANASPSPPSEGGEGRGEVGAFQPSTLNPQPEWVPAAGGFPGWPKSLKDFKLLDPCCGSGHFLVAAFVLLALMRMQDEKLSARDACDAVLRENLHGLELDPRCTQIAAFALALTAWRFTEGFRPLPPLNIACSGLGVNARKEDWLALANGDTRLRSGLEQLYNLFQKAPELGSLINPRQLAHSDLVTASFAEIQPLLTKALQSERAKRNDDLSEIGVAAQGMASAANLLASEYGLVLTNVPYLGRGKHGDTLTVYAETHHPNGKADLATCFVERCNEFCKTSGSVALVTPQNWWFLTSYTQFRSHLLTSGSIHVLATLGEEAWQSFGDRGPVTAMLIAINHKPVETQTMVGVDALSKRTINEKMAELKNGEMVVVTQAAQYRNPDHRIIVDEPVTGTLLQQYAASFQGVSPADFPRFGRSFWEVRLAQDWRLWQSAVEETKPFGGRSLVLWWNRGLTDAVEAGQAYIRGEKAWGKQGVACRQMRDLPCTLYTGEVFDTNAAVVVPFDPQNLPAIWAFCSSADFVSVVRRIDKKVNVTNASFVKVPFDLAHWQHVAAEEYRNGLPEPDSNDPTQWLFNGRLADSTTPLQVGVARLLGYRWPRQTGQTVSGAKPVPEDGLEQFADEDGIVCIPSVRGEAPAAERLRALLAAAYESGATVPVAGFRESSKPEACTTFGDVLQQTTYFKPYEPVEVSERNLPHWRQPHVCYFVTFRLADALPAEKLAALRAEREGWLKKHLEPHTDAEQKEYHRLFSQRIQDWLDAGSGSCLLRDDRVAEIVARALQHFDDQRYALGSWVVMPNHVHAVVTPKEGWLLDHILHSWKSFTAHEINRLMGRTGVVWQHEGYDHIVRNPRALWRIEEYIADNPRKAGIQTKWVHSRLPGKIGTTVPVGGSQENGKPEACSTFPAKLDELLSAVDYAGSNLEDWLRNGFFEQHCAGIAKRGIPGFHHRPFIWQIWDGRKDGFSALVNYHKLDHKLLEKLTYTYLGDWIKKQQEAVANEESGADDRLLKAQQLQDKLKLILEGEAPYDIFVRWKPLAQQSIGWHPDLNDGVRLNIRPFMEADVLRKRPNIKWGKDRGKNPPGSPWGEERDNDRHLTLAEKREARRL
jgi:REP element-mobilizing transposase RayT